jgi:hypothetical protein
MKMEVKQRMDGLVNLQAKAEMIKAAKTIFYDLFDDGFDEKDIYEYLLNNIKENTK